MTSTEAKSACDCVMATAWPRDAGEMASIQGSTLGRRNWSWLSCLAPVNLGSCVDEIRAQPAKRPRS